MKKKKRIKRSKAALLLCLLTASICGCQTTGAEAGRQRESLPHAIEKKRKTIVETAYSVVRSQSLDIKGKKFNTDCTGVILALCYSAGIDLTKDFGKYSGIGVSRLYSALNDAGLLYDTLYPLPGDIIFWDNTWDKNGDEKWNDPLTHTGLVVNTDGMGNIEYVHHHYRKGIIIEKMNLLNPDTYQDGGGIVNSPMRMRNSKPNTGKWLSGQLYHIFGMSYYY